MYNINYIRSQPAPIVLNISYSPETKEETYITPLMKKEAEEKGEGAVPKTKFYWIATGTNTTFEPVNIILPEGIVVLEYRWNLGDGTETFGKQVGHTYIAENPELIVSLTVLDSRLLEWTFFKTIPVLAAYEKESKEKESESESGATSTIAVGLA